MKSGPWPLVAIAFGLLLSVSGRYLRGVFHFPSTSELPLLSKPDFGPNGRAGVVTRVSGVVHLAAPLSTYLGQAHLSQGGQKERLAVVGMELGPETLFRVRESAFVEFRTEGGWVILMEGMSRGGGEFLFQWARREDGRAWHTSAWKVVQGRFSARPQELDGAERWLEIQTPTARIQVRNGEAGVSMGAGERGQAWLLQGEAHIRWNDGRSSRISARRMEHL